MGTCFFPVWIWLGFIGEFRFPNLDSDLFDFKKAFSMYAFKSVFPHQNR